MQHLPSARNLRPLCATIPGGIVGKDAYGLFTLSKTAFALAFKEKVPSFLVPVHAQVSQSRDTRVLTTAVTDVDVVVGVVVGIPDASWVAGALISTCAEGQQVVGRCQRCDGEEDGDGELHDLQRGERR